MRHKTNFLFLFFINSISTTCTAEIKVNGADVDVGTNATTLVLLMDSDLKSVYAVLFSCTYSMICDNCSETRHFKNSLPDPGL